MRGWDNWVVGNWENWDFRRLGVLELLGKLG